MSKDLFKKFTFFCFIAGCTSTPSGNKDSSKKGEDAASPAPTKSKFTQGPVLEPYPGLQISDYKMENGMRVLLVPRVQNGTLVVAVGFKVGSRNEVAGKTGLAHLFEHMMFRGTESFPEPFRTLSEWGSNFNAFTSQDQTVYYEMVPAQKLEEVMKFESERMRKLLITPALFNTERGAVVSERKMNYEDSPQGRLFWELYQNAFDVHPYKTIPIGWQEDVEKATFEDALSFYRRFYAPNRATLTLVGDFEIPAALQVIEKYFGKYKAVDSAEVATAKENIYRKNRRKVVKLKSQNVIMGDAVFSPEAASPDTAAELFFCVLLADSSMGYLRHTLVEKNIARSVSASCYPDVDTSLSVIKVTGAPGVTAAELEKKYKEAWKGFLEWAKNDRFENVKKYFETSQLESLRNPMDLAQSLVSNATTSNDPLSSFKLVEKVKALKFEAIEERFKEWSKRGGTRILIEPAETNDPMKKG